MQDLQFELQVSYHPSGCIGPPRRGPRRRDREVTPMLLETFAPSLAECDRITNRALGADGGTLPMDVVRRGEELVVRVDLPGVPADKIGVTGENQTLTLSVGPPSAHR